MEKCICPRCRAEIDSIDIYCRRCGLNLLPLPDQEFAEAVVIPERKLARTTPFDNPWLMLVFLFFVLGPFALPMLWHGKAFTPLGKWILSLLTVAFTLLALWLVWIMVDKLILEPFRHLQLI